MIDLINEIWQTLRNNKVRTMLTGIAVTWGVFMLIVLLAVANSVTDDFEEDVNKGSMERIRVFGGRTSVPWQGNKEGRRIRLEERDLREVPIGAPEYVKDIRTNISGGAKVTSDKGEVSQSYEGVYPSEIIEQHSDDLTEGRLLNDRDMSEARKVVVLPKSFMEQLFPPEGKDGVGKIVKINGLAFRVVGVYESRWNKGIYIPYTTAFQMAADKNDLGELTVMLKNVKTEEDGKAAEQAVKNTLARTHKFDPKDERALWISNYFTNSLTAKNGMAILDVSVWVLGILTLLTGIVGTSNIMFVSVKERTHEIGIRRAIGAKPRKILTQILAESVAITLLFGYGGIALGTGVTYLIAAIMKSTNIPFTPVVNMSLALEVTAVLVVAGAVAGLFPALKALKVKPVEALRDE